MDNRDIPPTKVIELRHLIHGAITSLRAGLNGESDIFIAAETAKSLNDRALEILQLP